MHVFILLMVVWAILGFAAHMDFDPLTTATTKKQFWYRAVLLGPIVIFAAIDRSLEKKK